MTTNMIWMQVKWSQINSIQTCCPTHLLNGIFSICIINTDTYPTFFHKVHLILFILLHLYAMLIFLFLFCRMFYRPSTASVIKGKRLLVKGNTRKEAKENRPERTEKKTKGRNRRIGKIKKYVGSIRRVHRDLRDLSGLGDICTL